MGLSNSINWYMGHRSAYCGNYFLFAFIPIIPETPFLTQLLDHLESVNNGTTDTSAAVALEADASRNPTAIWHLPCSYLTGCPWLSLSILAIIPRYSGHWFGMVRAAREENMVLHLQSIYTIIPCVFPYDAVSYAQYLSYYTVTMSKRVESHPGSAEFWQRRFFVQMGSCDPFANIPADRARQKLSIVTPKLLVEQRDSASNQQRWENITFPQNSEAQFCFVEWYIIQSPAVIMLMSSCLDSQRAISGGSHYENTGASIQWPRVMAIQFVGQLAAQDISCGLGSIEKKLTNVSNKDSFALMKLRPNFMANKRRWNWRASLTWTIKSPSVWKTMIPVCMLTGICLHG